MPQTNTEQCVELTSDIDEMQKLRKELKHAEEKAKDYLSKLTYLQAEFENYKKRVQREITQSTQYGNLKLISELLPILDELEYALNTGEKNKPYQGLFEGVKLILHKLENILKKEGLTPIQAKGELFDPYLHHVIQRDSNGEGQDVVTEEIRKGYMFRGKVIRPSLVKVVSLPTKENSKKESGNNE